jgi:hypothetical protein
MPLVENVVTPMVDGFAKLLDFVTQSNTALKITQGIITSIVALMAANSFSKFFGGGRRRGRRGNQGNDPLENIDIDDTLDTFTDTGRGSSSRGSRGGSTVTGNPSAGKNFAKGRKLAKLGKFGRIAAAIGGSGLGKMFGGVIDGVKSGVGSLSKFDMFSKLASPFKMFTKILGPAFAVLGGISDISSQINQARESESMGKSVDRGMLGRDMVKSGAYPLTNLAMNLIPGVGTAISALDGIAGAFGLSPIKFVTDNLIDLIPADAFTSLGEMAIGKSDSKSPAIQAEDALIRPGQAPILFNKDDIILAGTNLLGDKSSSASSTTGGSNRDNQRLTDLENAIKKTNELLSVLISKVDQPVYVTMNGKVIDEFDRQTSMRRNYRTTLDPDSGIFA